MSLVVSVYDSLDDGFENLKYLLTEVRRLSLDEAAAMFLDIDPAEMSINQQECRFAYVRKFTGKTISEVDIGRMRDVNEDASSDISVKEFIVIDDMMVVDADMENARAYDPVKEELKSLFRQFQKIRRKLLDAKGSEKPASPLEWITLALSVDISIGWLGWAKRKDIVNVDSGKEEARSTEGRVQVGGREASEVVFLQVIGVLRGLVLEKADRRKKRFSRIRTQKDLAAAIESWAKRGVGVTLENYASKFALSNKVINEQGIKNLKSHVDKKSRTSYLNMIGAFVDMIVRGTDAENDNERYTSIISEEELIEAITINYPDLDSLSPDNLRPLFVEAKKNLSNRNEKS